MDTLLEKPEFPAILEPGFHKMSIEELKETCVNSFEANQRRLQIFERFSSFMSILQEIPADFELWIDGSFTTKKDNPEDIDIVIFATPEIINRLSEEDKRKLSYLISNQEMTKARFLTDAYFIPKDDIVMRSYWRGWYGFTRKEEPKGVISLEIGK